MASRKKGRGAAASKKGQGAGSTKAPGAGATSGAGADGANGGGPDFEDFTGQTVSWFSQAQRILEEAETGELPPERGGGYIEQPRFRALPARLAVASAGVVLLAGLLWWAVG